MKTWLTNPVVLGGMTFALAVVATAPALAGHAMEVRGVVEQLPDTPDGTGAWLIDGHVVVVEADTRIEERTVRAGAESGSWTQAATGIVVRAPAWPAAAAYAAGFRPAIASEVGRIGLGRVVKAKVEPEAAGGWRALEIELGDDPSRHAAR
jgi:hypothetical protein